MSQKSTTLSVSAELLSIRLIYPFHTKKRESLFAMLDIATLKNARLKNGKHEDQNVWENTSPHGKYLEEALPASVHFLFGDKPQRKGDNPQKKDGYDKKLDEKTQKHETFAGAYRVNRALTQKWFGNTTAVVLNGELEERWRRSPDKTHRPKSIPIQFDHDLGIELFVAPCGAGAISIPIDVLPHAEISALDPKTIQDITYYLSHLEYRVPVLRRAHPNTDPHLKGDLTGHDCPAIHALLYDRLGHAGGRFTLSEIIELIIGAPKAAGLISQHQSQFNTYVVVRYSNAVSILNNSLLRGQVIGLAQLEESGHASPDLLDPGIPVLTMNANHIVAMSSLGVAHIVADQYPLVDDELKGFDAQRVFTIKLKYFGAYLVAVFQRIKLAQFRSDAASLAAQLEQKPARQNGRSSVSRDLHLELSRFAAAGELHEVSRREAVNRFFLSMQEVLRIDLNLAGLHRILRDIAAAERSDVDGAHLTELAETQAQLAETQTKVEYIEIFIVSFYSFEMTEILGKNLAFSHEYLAITTMVAAAVGAASIVLLVVRKPSATQTTKVLWFFLIAVLAFVWYVVGMGQKEGLPPTPPTRPDSNVLDAPLLPHAPAAVIPKETKIHDSVVVSKKAKPFDSVVVSKKPSVPPTKPKLP